MRMLVAGGRAYNDRARLDSVLDGVRRDFPDLTAVISGMAPGADSLAASWARRSGLKLLPFPADWQTHGRAAGFIRNRQMLDEGRPELAVLFPGGPGTAHMRSLLVEANIPTIEVI